MSVYSGTVPAGATAGNTTNAVLDFHQQVPPQVAKELYVELGEPANNFINLLRMYGRKIYVPTYYFEAEAEGRITANVTTTGSVTQNSVDTAITLTLSSADHVNGESYPSIGDIVTFPLTITNQYYMQGRIMAKNTSAPTAHTISVAPIDGSLAIGTVASGTVLTITSQVSANNTGQPQSKHNFPMRRRFYLQISKVAVEQDGRVMITPTYSEPNGTFDVEVHKAQIRLEKIMNGALLLGTESLSTSTGLAISATETAQWDGSGTGNVPTTTKGIWRHFKDLGGEVAVAAGAEALTDFRAIKEYELTQGINTSNMISMGGSRRIGAYSTLIKAANANGGADYITKMLAGNPNSGERAGYAAYFDFSSYTEGNTTFNLCELSEFTDPNVLGATGFNGTNQMMTIPVGIVKSARDANVSWPNFAIMYMKNGGYSREMEALINAGAGGGVYNIQVDKKIKQLRTDFGAFCMGANQGYITTP